MALEGVQALALKLTTATNGNFDVDEHLQTGPAAILAPLAYPNPINPAQPAAPVGALEPTNRAHEETYGNRPVTLVLPRQLRRWRGHRSIAAQEPVLEWAA